MITVKGKGWKLVSSSGHTIQSDNYEPERRVGVIEFLVIHAKRWWSNAFL